MAEPYTDQGKTTPRVAYFFDHDVGNVSLSLCFFVVFFFSFFFFLVSLRRVASYEASSFDVDAQSGACLQVARQDGSVPSASC